MLVVGGKYRRHVMVPAGAMVVLPQNPSTGNWHIPGCSLFLACVERTSVLAVPGIHAQNETAGRLESAHSQSKIMGKINMSYSGTMACYQGLPSTTVPDNRGGMKQRDKEMRKQPSGDPSGGENPGATTKSPLQL